MLSSSLQTASLAAILAATYLTASWSGQREPEELHRPLETIPYELGEWRGADEPRLRKAEEEVLRATSYLKRSYDRGPDEHASLFVAFYALQRAGEAMHSPKNCLPGSGWEIWNYDQTAIPFEGGDATINKYYIQRGNERLMVLYWYQSYDRVVASEYHAKICLVWDSVMKHRTSGSIVRVTVDATPEAEQYALELARDVLPAVRAVLPR